LEMLALQAKALVQGSGGGGGSSGGESPSVVVVVVVVVVVACSVACLIASITSPNPFHMTN
jgi:hypothetical protein